MRIFRSIATLTVFFITVSMFAVSSPSEVKGSVVLPKKWTAFILPDNNRNFQPKQADLQQVPQFILCGKTKVAPRQVTASGDTLDLKKEFGKDKIGNCAILYLEIPSSKKETVTLGFGADWWFEAWLNGKKIADTLREGNKAWPPSCTNYLVNVTLNAGKNLLVVKFIGGSGSSIVKVGGPVDLKKIPRNRWDVQITPVMMRTHYAGIKLQSAPKSLRLSSAVVALPEKPTVQEQKAAEELSVYLQKITGKKIQVVTENDNLKENVIYVGKTKFAASVNAGFDSYEEEQWLNRTVDGNLILGGGGMRGTLYAVWHFLEESCGVRWWTPYEEFVPANPELQVVPLDKQGKPVFSFRTFATHNRMITKSGKESLWAPRNRVNGELHWSIPVEYGGSLDYGTPGFVHTEAGYLREMKRRKILKPEWCALKSGVRGGKNNFMNQLCLSNKEMRKAFLVILKDFIAADRKKFKNPPTIYNISFNDTSTKCECQTCAETAKKYACDTGLLLELINEMANGIAEEYPDIKIATLAYMNTEPVPIGIKPADNVIITLCDTLCNYLKPIPEDERFGRLMKVWSSVTKNIYIWDYHSNFADKCLPMPFESTIQTDWQLMKKNSVSGIFTEYYPVFEDMWYLRIYLMAKLAENPFIDQQKVILDFTDGYYGKAGIFIRQYLKAVNDAARNDKKSYVGTQSPMEKCGYITPAFAAQIQKIFDQAEQAVSGNKTLLRRVRHARLAADKVAYILYPKFKSGMVKDSREKIAGRIRDTVKNECAIAMKDLLPYWKKRHERFIEKFLSFLESSVVWDNCDNIERRTWAQRAWRPKPYASTEVGKLTQSQSVKFAGTGSIRFEVTYDDVKAKMNKMPKLDRIGFNYLHGSDFSRYTAYEFYIKCESPNHPDIIVSIGYTKWTTILKRNEVTNGWKKVRIPCEGLFKKPCTHTYLRVFSTPKSFAPGDKIDFYIDEMKLYR